MPERPQQTWLDTPPTRPALPKLPRRWGEAGFTVIEVLVSLAIIAVLLAMLIPALTYARHSARTSACGSNLRQIGAAFLHYLSDHGTFPQYRDRQDWKYGGVVFLGGRFSHPVLAADRPVNPYIADAGEETASTVTAIFRCPADVGVYARGGGSRGSAPCFELFGTSYRANPLLMDATLTGIDPDRKRPLKLTEIAVADSRLILLGDPIWWYASRPKGDPDWGMDASWHRRQDAGHVLALDGSIRFAAFQRGTPAPFAIDPRPGW